ncbi:MAG TPA: M2 family metallopeptidase, partial [Lacunisphaera sp.]|nr:M2 family metallopeptidase [Lacunisphaera sp.]
MTHHLAFALRGAVLATLAASAGVFAADRNPTQERADRFLQLVNASYQALAYVENEAQWSALTDVSPVHDAAAETAGKASAAFMGNPALINETKALLLQRHDLDDLTIRQLEKILLLAAEQPMTNPKLTQARIEAETKQASTLNGFEFKLEGKPVTVNEIDNLLQSNDTPLDKRLAVWLASKESGKALKDGLVKLRDLRNGVAKEMGYHDYFALQVAGYGMTTEEMIKLNEEFMQVLKPLYLHLHTWTKYKLAERFRQPVPKRIPAHWINNRWAQEWDGLADGANLDNYFKKFTPEWVAQSSEKFYVGLGFPALPKS